METFNFYSFFYYVAIIAGIIAGLLFLISFLSGTNIINIDFKWHKRIGITAFTLMCIHMILIIILS
ncbi:MAG: hypothetical protein PHH25_07880 [Bacteroidales bacterium]|nr:hypothetical protein [Bacteroidales bacterium]